MKIILALITFTSFSLLAEVEFDYFGNLEYQARQAHNHQSGRDQAKADGTPEWNQETFHLLYGNLSGRVGYDSSSIEFNFFARYAQSELYELNSLNTQIYNFPERIVSRDLFKLTHSDQGRNSRFDLIANKFFYEWETEDSRFVLGRMFVNYGMGEIYNPINPFSTPQGITVLNNVAQGSDGLRFTLFPSLNHTINFYILGDKRIYNYEGRYSRTLWAQGELVIDDKLQAIYVLGEDQKRFKSGFQLSYQLARGILFAQYLRTSKPTDNTQGNSLDDYLIGYDRQLSNTWHLRVEAGYQKEDPFRNYSVFDERFLPQEYFIALANSFQVHPLVKLTGTLFSDPDANFHMLIFKSTYNAYSNFEVDFYALGPIRGEPEKETKGQRVISTDIGLSLRYFY